MLLSPGLTNENVVLVTVEVDMRLDANMPDAARQELGEGEDIELLRCAVSDLMPTLRRLDAEANVRVFAGLWTLACGLEVGSRAQARL